LWLVDFEFAAAGDPWCELGNLSSGAALEPGEVEQLVTAYAGRPVPHRVARTRLWDAVCSWTWVLWASLQDAAGELDHDYRSLAESLADRAREGLDPQLVRRHVRGRATPACGARPGSDPG
jgi:thiamine kinase-like enzyme